MLLAGLAHHTVYSAIMSLRQFLEMDSRLSRQLRLEAGGSLAWKLAAFFAHSGDSWFWMAGLIVLWLLNVSFWRYTAVILAVGVVGLALLVLVIKFTVRRQRPPGEWGAIYRNTDPHSFPSGHAARAAMLAVLAVGLGPAWFGWLMVFWAPLVCLARISTGMHYLSDVLAGIILGIVSGLVLLQLAPWISSIIPFMF